MIMRFENRVVAVIPVTGKDRSIPGTDWRHLGPTCHPELNCATRASAKAFAARLRPI